MEIDKDKVVEAARAYVECTFNKEITCDVLKERDKLLIALKEALNPPPARPSKEKCIEYLNEFIECVNTQDELFIKGAISYLKEPSLQWVKNTGEQPSCKFALLRLFNGKYRVINRDFNDTMGDDAKEYIILE